MPRTFVTGYDASPASRAALSHALDRSEPDGRVIVVHACSLPGEAIGMGFYSPILDQTMARGADLLDHLAEVDPRAVPERIETELVGTDPASALAAVARTREADGIVIGTRGFGRARALLGSVAHELIHKAECPVTVIPERAVVHSRAKAKSLAAA
jgi:nucleotide-binding universal stress UspA family protein